MNLRMIAMTALFLLIMGCGSGLSPDIAYGGFDRGDIYPVVYGTNEDADLNNEVYIAAWDDTLDAWQRLQIGVDDFDRRQWSPQRGTIVYRTNGMWGIVLIESGGDLELWEAPNAGYSINGVWALTDDDNTRIWTSSDIICEQGMYSGLVSAGGTIDGCYIEPAGAGVWRIATTGYTGVDQKFSVCKNKGLAPLFSGTMVENLVGNLWQTGLDVIDYAPWGVMYRFDTGWAFGNYDYPQVVCDKNDNIWVYCEVPIVGVNYSTIYVVYPAIGHDTLAQGFAGAALSGNTSLDSIDYIDFNFNATCNFSDGTMHFCVINGAWDGVTDVDFELIYQRRTSSGWSDEVVLDSWTLPQGGTANLQVDQGFPSIGVDPFNNLWIYYVKIIVDLPPYGDLTRAFLGAVVAGVDQYHDYSNPANWDLLPNIDNSGDDILWCETLGNQPI